MPNTDSKTGLIKPLQKTVGWDEINWRKVERYIFKLETRIYAASRRENLTLGFGWEGCNDNIHLDPTSVNSSSTIP
jgi:hypothetical protein